MSVLEALGPPPDAAAILERVPELEPSRGLGQSPYHHLDTFGHTLEVVRRVDEELRAGTLGARVGPGRVEGLRLAALLHDVAKPVTRGELGGRVLFVAHDSVGALLVRRVCRRLGLAALPTDMAVTLTALHLKIGFMEHPEADYPPRRLALAAGPFGEELAVLSWADRLAAQGPRLKDEHIERHRRLCGRFLRASRELGPHPPPEYGGLARRLPGSPEAELGYVAALARLIAARGGGGDPLELARRLL
ncbi:metal dependent phosphohydrolase [Rubrobacter xylanophilus DSM 9941]|uniref:Metal dependent phosphohydrolase n=1 Tax=Rubrobacter xylanophilus (strain DSM 9941 / JCM 11954 / NBRC 16129 / PRD-1) TaxID=266117 RepID=Q1AXV4_RUBXD|nr:metal dependent phosphohydrolase [Rubrobacter xylanophilus DSM 9941]